MASWTVARAASSSPVELVALLPQRFDLRGEVGHGRRGYKCESARHRARTRRPEPGTAGSALDEDLGDEDRVAPLHGADPHLGEVRVEQVLPVGRRGLERGLGRRAIEPAMATFSPISCQPGAHPGRQRAAEWKMVLALAMRCGLGLGLEVELVATLGSCRMPVGRPELVDHAWRRRPP